MLKTLTFSLALLFSSAAMYCQDNQYSKPIVFQNINLIAMTSPEIKQNQSVVIIKDRIAEIGENQKVNIPDGAIIIDGTGKYLMPGLADMHVHLISPEWITPEANMYLANGVTTVRDLTQWGYLSIKKWCDDYNSKRRLGPTIYNAWNIRGNEPKILEILPVVKQNDYNCIKLNDYLKKSDFYNVINEAKKLGIYVTGHIPYRLNIDDVVKAGMDEITHVELLPIDIGSMAIRGNKEKMSNDILEKKLMEESIKILESVSKNNSQSALDKYHKKLDIEIGKLIGKEITIITTLVADEALSLKYNDTIKLQERMNNKYIPDKFWNDLRMGKDKNSFFIGHEKAAKAFYDLITYSIGEIRRNKLPIVSGTDAGPVYMGIVPGFSLHDELQLLVEAGYTPYEAIVSATREASKVIKKMTGKDDFGTIEIGKKADFIFLDNNPLENVKNLRNPSGVMTAGIWLPKEKLNQLLNVKRKLITPILREVLKQTDEVDSVIAEYRKLCNSNFMNDYYMTEGALTNIGYDFLKLNRIDDAIKIFKLNIEEYPFSPNVYDSIAEAYLKKGEKELSKMYYQKALTMDPNFQSAIEALTNLEK